MNINEVYINLPIKNVQKTKAFWEALGFKINEHVVDDKAVCVILKENLINVMFLTEDFFETFSERPVPKGDTTQVLVAISLNSREEVDEIVNAAVANGAYQHEEAQDHGWMYQNSFWDINGHGWNVVFSDPTQFPQE